MGALSGAGVGDLHSFASPSAARPRLRRASGRSPRPALRNALEKSEGRPEQKTMRNGTQQARNVDGSLTLRLRPPPAGPVLLVDDAWTRDGRWRSRLVAAVERRRGGLASRARRLRPPGLNADERRASSRHAGDSPAHGAVDGGPRSVEPPPLTDREYNRLAGGLRERGRQPADLMDGVREALGGRRGRDRPRTPRTAAGARLSSRPGRGALARQGDLGRQPRRRRLSPAPQGTARGTRAPGPLRLRGAEGPRRRRLAVVGSRNAGDDMLACAVSAGRLAAAARRAVISGGARGVDRAAMNGALEDADGRSASSPTASNGRPCAAPTAMR